MNLLGSAEAQYANPVIPDLEEDIVDGSVGIRSKQNALALRNQCTNDVRDGSGFASPWHTQHKSVIFCGHDFCDSSTLIRVHRHL